MASDAAPAAGPDDPFLVTAQGADGLTHAQTRSARFVLTSRGVRLPVHCSDERVARQLAAQLPLRPDTALSHLTATRIHVLPVTWALEMLERVEVTAPRGTPRPRRRDIVTHHAQLPDQDVCLVGGFRVTSPARTYADMASRLGFDYLVALGDVVLRCPGTTPELLHQVATARLRYPGRARALAAIPWLDPGAASPRESHLRVLLRRARLPRPEVNGIIRDEYGGFLAMGDLVFRRLRVVAEYDGEVHATMDQRAKDAARRAVLREHGWIVVEIVGEDMRYPHRVAARVRSALRDAAARTR